RASPGSGGSADHFASLTIVRVEPSAKVRRSAQRKAAALRSFQQSASRRWAPAERFEASSSVLGFDQSSPWPASRPSTKRRKWLSALTKAVAFVGADSRVIARPRRQPQSSGWRGSPVAAVQIQRAPSNGEAPPPGAADAGATGSANASSAPSADPRI